MFDNDNIFKIIEEALELSKGSININSSQENVENWDSLGQLSILSALDEQSGGKVADIPELAGALSSKEIIDILKDNLLVK